MSEIREKVTGTSDTLNIAFLACDKIPEEAQEAHGEYADVLHNLFEPLIPKEMKFKTHAYDVVHKRQYPSDADLENIDALVISGSFEDDADNDSTWILRLAGFLIRVADDMPRIRILGICFGLQIIARAFGPSPIVKNEKGWEVGTTKVNLTDVGRRIVWGHDEEGTNADKDHVMMQQIHSDIVHKCPEGFDLLGYSDKTPVQGIAKFYDKNKEVPAFTHTKGGKSPESFWQSIHMIAFQGHPEWHEDILIPLVDNYERDGVYDKEFAEGARKSVRSPDDGERIGKVLLKVLGIL